MRGPPPLRAPMSGRQRALVVLLTVAVAGWCWRAARPSLIDHIGLGSVGCPGRSDLVAHAFLGRSAPAAVEGLPLHSATFRGDGIAIVAWQMASGEPLDAYGRTLRTPYVIFDHAARLLGRFRNVPWQMLTPPGDRDSDGRVEIVLSFDQPRGRNYLGPRATSIVVLRLGPPQVEIAGLVFVDEAPWLRLGRRVQCAWRSGARIGGARLVIESLPSLTDSDSSPSRIVELAALRWTGAGGVLVPETQSPTETLLVWAPPEARPSVCAVDAALDEVCERVLPIPRGFGETGPLPLGGDD